MTLPTSDLDLLRAEGIRRYTYSIPLWQRLGLSLSKPVKQLTTVIVAALGFDISAWQVDVDFQIAKDKQIKFAWMRALNGLSVDVKFVEHWQKSKGKIKRGPYLYYKDNLDPVDQAVKLLSVVSETGDIGELPPALDVESYNNPTLTASKIKKCLETLANQLQKTPLVYTNYYVWRDDVSGDKSFAAAYPLWIAGYPLAGWEDDYPERVLNYPPMVPTPWTGWDAWQWTAFAPANEYGVSGNTLDLDYCSQWFYDTYLAPQSIIVPIETEYLATHKLLTSGVLYLGPWAGDWNMGINAGQLVQVLATTPRNGRVHIYRIHPRVGGVFGWLPETDLEILPEPVLVQAVWPVNP